MTPPWPTRPLAEQAVRVLGRVDPRTLPRQTYVGLEHMRPGGLRLRGTGHSDTVTSACFRYQPGDVLFGRLRPYFRKVVRAPGTGLCTTEAWVLRPREGVDPEFLFYAVADPRFVERCTRTAEGTRMPRARWDFVSRLAMPCPELDEQRRIAAALGAFDRRIAHHHAEAHTLQDLVEALFRERILARAERWPRGQLGDLAVVHRDTVSPKALDPATPCVGLADMARGSLALETWGRAGAATSPKRRFATGDVLFGRLRPVFRKVALAPVDGVCSSDILVLRPRGPHHRSLLLSWLLHEPFTAHAVAVATGTRMPRASWKALARWPVPSPPPPVLAAFEADTAPLLDRLLAGIPASLTLAALRDALLPDLLSGRRRL